MWTMGRQLKARAGHVGQGPDRGVWVVTTVSAGVLRQERAVPAAEAGDCVGYPDGRRSWGA